MEEKNYMLKKPSAGNGYMDPHAKSVYSPFKYQLSQEALNK